jgi:FKBP-type peptidyl-prolyl cis-trans isomerase
LTSENVWTDVRIFFELISNKLKDFTMNITLKWSNALAAICIALTLLSCEEESFYTKQANIDDQKITKFLNDNNIQATKHSSGFYYQVLTPNDAGASLSLNDVVDFNYKVTLLDGTVVEDSMAAKKPAKVKLLNYSIVPEALDLGISLMKVGSIYRFYIPSNLAFGDYRSSKIPSRAILLVDVKVIRKQSETEVEQAQLDSIDHYVQGKYANTKKLESGLYYIETVAGNGYKPHLGDRVRINMTRKYLDGTVIKSFNDVTFYLGHDQAVPGLEEGIMQMQTGGKAILIMPASLAFQQSLCLIPQNIRTELLQDQLITAEVLPYSIVTYEVELKGWNL